MIYSNWEDKLRPVAFFHTPHPKSEVNMQLELCRIKKNDVLESSLWNHLKIHKLLHLHMQYFPPSETLICLTTSPATNWCCKPKIVVGGVIENNPSTRVTGWNQAEIASNVWQNMEIIEFMQYLVRSVHNWYLWRQLYGTCLWLKMANGVRCESPSFVKDSLQTEGRINLPLMYTFLFHRIIWGKNGSNWHKFSKLMQEEWELVVFPVDCPLVRTWLLLSETWSDSGHVQVWLLNERI